jgi:uncharacterized protein
MGKSQYKVRFGGLPIGIHEYEFEVGDKFFKEYPESGIGRATVEVKATLTKQNNLLQMHFSFSGTVGLECDRCMKDFNFPVSGEEDLVIRHGDPAESTDEILVIPEGEDQFEVSQLLYEYITTAVPARRVPCEIDDEAFECDEETLSRLNEISRNIEPTEKSGEDVWEELNKVKYNKN